jgi:hypothetical protein
MPQNRHKNFCFSLQNLLFVQLLSPDHVSKSSKHIKKSKKKSKAVPLHAMEAHGERGGIAPTHS